MKIKLIITAGPHQGKEFLLDGHDTFLVGRTKDSHFQLTFDDPYFSRRQFLVEVNVPRARVIDLESRNGTLLNGVRIQTADVKDGDEIAVGQTIFKVCVLPSETGEQQTLNQTLALPSKPGTSQTTVDYQSVQASFPGYRLEGELGRGGMGVVYRATRERDGLPVAIKTVMPAIDTPRKQIDRFVRECEILAQLEHPNIVGFREVGEVNGLIFLAMDFVEGPDLNAWLKERGTADIAMYVRIICQMLKGLAHAHERGFVHRDIKPANILIGGIEGKRIARLADFGLARVYETSKISGLTMQGEVGGTPAFMAPEQVTHYREVKPHADQYSAAATLYKLLTDKYTHDFPTDLGAQLSHLVTAEPVPIVKRNPKIAAELAVVIHKALAREAENRYPDVLAFRKELKRFA